jgi:hypothetical protein
MQGGEKKGSRTGRGAIYCAVMLVLALAGWAPPAWAQLPDLPTQTPDHFLVVMLPAAVAGQPSPITVTAMNGLLPVLGYTGTITFSSTDPQAQLPAPYTFTGFGLGLDNGTHIFLTPSLRTAGEHIVTVTSAEGIGAATVLVSAGPADHLSLSGPASVTAGVPFDLTISARDLYENRATIYLGAIALASSDAQAQIAAGYLYLPADLGSQTFKVELRTAGAQTITATDVLLPVQTGIFSTSVAAGAATSFEVTTSASANAGQPLSVTVTARDSFGNAATGFTGTAHFASSDGQAVLPADYTFVPADNGTHTFTGVVLRTSGEQTITTTDPGNPDLGGSAIVTVAAGAATHLSAKAPASWTSGQPFGISITARDEFENKAGTYRGTLHFTTSGAQADLPADYTYTAADDGTHSFSGLVLRSAGTQTVTATDAGNGLSVSATLTIEAGAATGLTVSGPAQAQAHVPFTITVTARDAAGNVAVSYTGTVHFASSDAGASLPADYTFSGSDQGAHAFQATLAAQGQQSITATDTGAETGSVGGTIIIDVTTARMDAAAMAVDSEALPGSDGNGVLEAGESVLVAPSWSNLSGGVLAASSQSEGWTGPDAGHGAAYTVSDGSADYGTLGDGETASCQATGNCFILGVNTPGVRPLRHWDGSFTEALSNGNSMTWSLHVGDSFTDVPRSSAFYRFIETLLHRSVTGGCSGSTFCPAASSTRGQMAVFTLVAKEGVATPPPACVSGSETFADVPASHPFCRYIEELARRGSVTGCAADPARYCPDTAVTREQMAVFALRTLDPALTPPACVSGSEAFVDVPASNPYCRYIEELVRRNVVTGCSTSPAQYCPSLAVTREQMSVYITLTFGLTLYGL